MPVGQNSGASRCRSSPAQVSVQTPLPSWSNQSRPEECAGPSGKATSGSPIVTWAAPIVTGDPHEPRPSPAVAVPSASMQMSCPTKVSGVRSVLLWSSARQPGESAGSCGSVPACSSSASLNPSPSQSPWRFSVSTETRIPPVSKLCCLFFGPARNLSTAPELNSWILHSLYSWAPPGFKSVWASHTRVAVAPAGRVPISHFRDSLAELPVVVNVAVPWERVAQVTSSSAPNRSSTVTLVQSLLTGTGGG